MSITCTMSCTHVHIHVCNYQHVRYICNVIQCTDNHSTMIKNHQLLLSTSAGSNKSTDSSPAWTPTICPRALEWVCWGCRYHHPPSPTHLTTRHSPYWRDYINDGSSSHLHLGPSGCGFVDRYLCVSVDGLLVLQAQVCMGVWLWMCVGGYCVYIPIIQ